VLASLYIDAHVSCHQVYKLDIEHWSWYKLPCEILSPPARHTQVFHLINQTPPIFHRQRLKPVKMGLGPAVKINL